MGKLGDIYYEVVQDIDEDSQEVMDSWGVLNEHLPTMSEEEYGVVENLIMAHADVRAFESFKLGFTYAMELREEMQALKNPLTAK